MAEAETTPDWRSAVPEDIRSAPGLKDIKDVGSLAKSFLDAQSMIGSSIRLPSKEAGDEGRKAFRARMLEVGKDYGISAVPTAEEDDTPFYTSLGRPGKYVEYKLPEGVKPEGDLVPLLEAAHASNMTQRQFDRFYKKAELAALAHEQARLSAKETEEGTLKKEWGDAYDTRRGALITMLESHGAPEDLRKAYESGKLTAGSVKWLHDTLASLGGESQDLQGQGKKAGGKLTPDEAAARLDEVEKRMNAMNPGDPDYQLLIKRRLALIESANSA